MAAQSNGRSKDAADCVHPIRESIRRAQEGDQQAREAIVEFYQDEVFSYLSSRLQSFGYSMATVEDLAQETFIRVLQNLDRFEDQGPDSFRCWILTIARNLMWDNNRKLKRRAQLLSQSYANSEQSSESEMRLLVRDVVRDLAADDQDLVRLFYIEKYTMKEIAGLYGRTKRQVEYWLTKVRSQLRERLT